MRLDSFLKKRGIQFQLHRHESTFTSQELANEEHVASQMVAKPVIVKGEAGFAMCVLPASDHLDLERVAALLHENGVRLASEAEMANLFPDCQVGAEPPVGTLYGLKTIMDTGLLEDEYLIMQAGSHDESMTDAPRRLGAPLPPRHRRHHDQRQRVRPAPVAAEPAVAVCSHVKPSQVEFGMRISTLLSGFAAGLVLSLAAPLARSDGDANGDGSVDLADYSAFLDCVGAPGGGLRDGCQAFDFDGDQDVDFFDFAGLQLVFGF